jgi:transposase InsO family protein
VEGLPISGSASCILVVVDKFKRYAHFVSLVHPYTTVLVAKVFIDQVCKLHGMPVCLVSDRDKIFTSRLWKELFSLAKVQLCTSTAYHPPSDGQTKHMNQCMEMFLRCFVNECPRKWVQWLPLVEFWYNTSLHSAIGRSPFEALYGYYPKQFGLPAVDHVSVETLDQWLQEKRVIADLVK